MGVYNSPHYPDVGIELVRNVALSGTQKLTPANVIFSEDVLTDLENPQIGNTAQNVPYSLYQRSSNEFILEVNLTNYGVAAQYNLNTVIFYANDGTDDAPNVPLAIITAQQPDPIPPWSAYPINIGFKVIVSLDKNGNIIVDPTFVGFATIQDMADFAQSSKEYADAIALISKNYTDQKISGVIAGDELGFYHYGRTLAETVFPATGISADDKAYDFAENQAYTHNGTAWVLVSEQPAVQQGSRVDILNFLDGTDITGAAMAGMRGAGLRINDIWQFGLTGGGKLVANDDVNGGKYLIGFENGAMYVQAI